MHPAVPGTPAGVSSCIGCETRAKSNIANALPCWRTTPAPRSRPFACPCAPCLRRLHYLRFVFALRRCPKTGSLCSSALGAQITSCVCFDLKNWCEVPCPNYCPKAFPVSDLWRKEGENDNFSGLRRRRHHRAWLRASQVFGFQHGYTRCQRAGSDTQITCKSSVVYVYDPA